MSRAESGQFIPPHEISSDGEQPKQQPRSYEYPESGVASVTDPDKRLKSRRSFLRSAFRGGLGAAAFSHILRQKSDSSEASRLHAYMEHKDESYKLYEQRILDRVQRSTDYFLQMSDEDGLRLKLHTSAPTEDDRMRAFGNFLDLRGEVAAAHDAIVEIQQQLVADDDYKRELFRINREMERFEQYSKEHPSDMSWTAEYGVVLGTYDTFAGLRAAQQLRKKYGVSAKALGESTISGLQYVQQFYDLFPEEVVKKYFPKNIIFTTLPVGTGTALPFADAIVMEYGNSATTAHEITHFFSNRYAANEFALSNLGLVPRSKKHQAFRNLNTEDIPYVHDTGAGAIIDNKIFGEEGKRPTPQKGYVSEYAFEGGEEEDIAEVSTRLFERYSLTALVLDCEDDPVQTAKTEFIAGYKLDGPSVWAKRRSRGQRTLSPNLWNYLSKYGLSGAKQFVLADPDFSSIQYFAQDQYRELYEYVNNIEFVQVPTFGTPISEKEYKDKGFEGVEFWRKWLPGAVTAEFYNSILRGEKGDVPELSQEFIKPDSLK